MSIYESEGGGGAAAPASGGEELLEMSQGLGDGVGRVKKPSPLAPIVAKAQALPTNVKAGIAGGLLLVIIFVVYMTRSTTAAGTYAVLLCGTALY